MASRNPASGSARWACLVAAIVTGCNVHSSFGPQLQGSGVAKTEERSVADFSEIQVEAAVELEFIVGPATSVVVTADDNILPHVRTDVAGDRLRITVDASYSTSLGVKVTATAPTLAELQASGASRCTVDGVTGEEFRLDLSGASTCQLEGNVERMNAMLSGASQATLVGTVEELSVDCSGASRVEALDMPADRVTATVSGASTALVDAANELTANASGASTVRFRGEPETVSQDVSGASTIKAE